MYPGRPVQNSGFVEVLQAVEGSLLSRGERRRMPSLRPGNEDVKRYGRAIRAKPGITSVRLPVGTGLSRVETN